MGMFSQLRGVEQTDIHAGPCEVTNLRSSERFGFAGPAFPIRVGTKKSTMRLKDLSCGGASGIMEEPVAPGDIVTIELDAKNHVSAEVRWVRRVMIGIRFCGMIDPALVAKIRKKHCG